MRLFAALQLPPPMVERLTNFRLRLSTPKDGLRWTTPEQWHVTLQFFGEVTEEQGHCLETRTAEIPAVPPEMMVEGLGLFAAKGILFASLEPTASLLALQEVVQRMSAGCGISSESRPFRPHITLARSKGKAGLETLRRVSTPALPSLGTGMTWRANEVVLLESVLRQQGAEYLVRKRCTLMRSSQANERAK